jgi:HK97 family phage prohead protease
MTMIRKMVRAQVKALGDDQVEVRMSTATIARDGHILVPQGARLDNYRSNPVFLWNHDVDNFPVGKAESVTVQGQQIVALVRFPPTGISARADECRGLVKSGFINGVSVGFDPLDGQPLNPQKPRAGMRVTDWELLECSFCCVPVDADAVVTARAEKGTDRTRRSLSGMQSAALACDRALDEHRSAGRHHSEMADAIGRLDGHRAQAGTNLRAYKQALDKGDSETAIECQTRCQRSIEGMSRELRAIGDRHSEAMDSHEAMQRALREAANLHGRGGPSQTSNGLGDGESRARRSKWGDADYRRRQVEVLELAAGPRNDEHARRLRQIEYLELAAKAN